MMESRNDIRSIVVLLLVGMFLSILYQNMIGRKAVVELDLKTDTRTILKVYWQNDAGLYTEKDRARINIEPDQNKYSFRICNLENIPGIRIDTSERPARVTIKSLVIKQDGFPVLKYDAASGLDKIIKMEGVRQLTLDDNGLTVVPDGRDPQLWLQLPEMTKSSTWLSDSIRISCIFVAVFLLLWALSEIAGHYQYVNCLLVFVLALITVMASISKYNKHPDEFVHVFAAEYYQNHSMPPQVEAPEILQTYSAYGVSRLHSGEIVYFLAGKFLKLVEPLHLPSFLLLRFFNVCLFFFLVLCALKREEFRLFMLPVLVSPQIWYTFSYFNSDAFALFIILLAGYQVAVRDSMLNLIIQNGVRKNTWYYLVLTGLLFGLMLLLKKNFYFFYVFLFLYGIWKIFFDDWKLEKKFILRFGAVLLVACSLFGLARGTDYAVNGPNRGEKLLQAREHLAVDMYKPSTPLSKKHMYLQMKERGTTLKHFLQMDRWGEKSFRTSFGVYGYVTLSGSFKYYDTVRLFGWILLASILVPVLVRGGLSGISLLLVTVSVSLALIAVALHHAWTVDFQAQGRYFLPIIAMLSVFVFHTEKFYIRFIFQTFLLIMFTMSVYSFIFVGLHDIAKYGT